MLSDQKKLSENCINKRRTKQMGLTDRVEHHQIKDLIEFSGESFVRKPLTQSRGIVCDFVCFEPGQKAGLHKHPVQDEIFFVVEGKGTIIFEEHEPIPVKAGSVIFTPSGVTHGVETANDERLILMLIKGPGITAKDARSFMHGEQSHF